MNICRIKQFELCLCLVLPVVAVGAPRYTAEKLVDHGVEIIRLTDSVRSEQVSMVPSYGNRAYEFKVHGKNLLYDPFPTPAALKQDPLKGLNGVPFLAPWANRIGGGASGQTEKSISSIRVLTTCASAATKSPYTVC